MRIVVMGAGTVGTSIADLLCQHRHSVTVIDADPAQTKRVNNELDVGVVCGSAGESSVLFQAQVIGADLCLAVTGNDEVNIVGASMAKAMGARRAIARVYGPVFRDTSTFDYQAHFGIDRLLSLEHLSAMELARGIRSPGSLAIENLANGQLEVQETTIDVTSDALNKPLKTLQLPAGVRLGSIARGGRVWIAGAEDKIEIGDRITLIGVRENIDEVKDLFREKGDTKKGIVIAGGGETGYHLARIMDNKHFSVLLMETNRKRCEYVANALSHVTVVEADATRRAILEEERVGSADVFAACTGDDENNIMAGVEAREIGTETIMSIVSRPDYANIVGKLGIDLAVSPRNVMAKQVLAFLNRGAVVSRTPLADGSIALFEIEVREGASVTEHVLANLPLPNKCLIAAILRGEHAHVPGADDRLKPGDTVVALVEDAESDEMLSLFETN